MKDKNPQLAPKKKPYCSHCGGFQDRLMSIAQTAKVFDLSEQAIRSMIKRREIPIHRMGKRIRISYQELRELFIRYASILEVELAYQDSVN